MVQASKQSRQSKALAFFEEHGDQIRKWAVLKEGFGLAAEWTSPDGKRCWFDQNGIGLHGNRCNYSDLEFATKFLAAIGFQPEECSLNQI